MYQWRPGKVRKLSKYTAHKVLRVHHNHLLTKHSFIGNSSSDRSPAFSSRKPRGMASIWGTRQMSGHWTPSQPGHQSCVLPAWITWLRLHSKQRTTNNSGLVRREDVRLLSPRPPPPWHGVHCFGSTATPQPKLLILPSSSFTIGSHMQVFPLSWLLRNAGRPILHPSRKCEDWSSVCM